MKRVAIALVAASVLCGDAWAQVNLRKMLPAERAFLDRIAAEFPKILPPVPAGWVEVERRIHDQGDMTSDWDAPMQADYEVQLVVADIEERKKIVEARMEAAVDRNRPALDAAAAQNQKLMEEFSAKLEAAMKRNDQAEMKRLQEDFEKKMPAGGKAASLPTVAAPELSDSYARIRLWINPYSESVNAEEKKLAKPPGFVDVARRAPLENNSDREGVTRYLLGKWELKSDALDYTLKFTPNRGAVVYGIVLEIEARADRADALFRAMNRTRLQALLQP